MAVGITPVQYEKAGRDVQARRPGTERSAVRERGDKNAARLYVSVYQWSSCPPLHYFAGRNSFAKPKESGQEAPVVWPRPLGLVGRGNGGGSGAGAISTGAQRSVEELRIAKNRNAHRSGSPKGFFSRKITMQTLLFPIGRWLTSRLPLCPEGQLLLCCNSVSSLRKCSPGKLDGRNWDSTTS
jgi:hypothetical protein